MKKRSFIAGMLTMLLLFGLIGTVSATVRQEQVTVSYTNAKITLDGEDISLTTTAGEPIRPFIIDGTTYLPLRSISNILGFDVDWDSVNGNISLSNQTPTVEEKPAEKHSSGTSIFIPIQTTPAPSPIPSPEITPTPSPEPSAPPEEENDPSAAYQAELDALTEEYNERIYRLQMEKSKFRDDYYKQNFPQYGSLGSAKVMEMANKAAANMYDPKIADLEREKEIALHRLSLKYNDPKVYEAYIAEYDAMDADYNERIHRLQMEKSKFRDDYYKQNFPQYGSLGSAKVMEMANKAAADMYDGEIQSLTEERERELAMLELKYFYF